MSIYRFHADVTITVIAENAIRAHKEAAKVEAIGQRTGFSKPAKNRDFVRHSIEAVMSSPKLLRQSTQE